LTTLVEADVEQAVLRWLACLGWGGANSQSIDSDGQDHKKH